MDFDKYVPIGEFARLSGIRRKNLIFYDEIGLFSPARVDPNGYRYYSYSQFDTAVIIWSLKDIGMSLKDIRAYIETRTPEKLLGLLCAQKRTIDDEIAKLRRIRGMMDARERMTERGMAVDTSRVALVEAEEEALFLGDEVDRTDGEAVMNSLATFYDLCAEHDIYMGYPFGATVSRENLARRDYAVPSRYYFRIEATERGERIVPKPAGLYAVAHGHGGYWQTDGIYERLTAFIEENGLDIRGDSYEEMLLDEISTRDPEAYLCEISIPVSKK